jgi:hypothetical protein
MRTMPAVITLTLTAAITFPLFAPLASASEEVYTKMANDIAKYSANKKVKNLAVLGFSRKARTSREESEYISEKLLSCLVASGKVNLLERSQLAKVLEERRLAASGVAEETPDAQTKIDPSDVIIVGTIFGTKEHLKIIAKMIDPFTGAVLHTVEGETERQWEILPERDHDGYAFEVPDLREIAAMFSEEGFNNPAFVDFRDAPITLGTETCNARRSRLLSMQQESLDAKAKYWAMQMRDPAFSSAKIRRNPGGEIKDAAAKKKFYAMLDAYYRAPESPSLSVAEMNAVLAVMSEEERVSDDCGLH